MKRIVAAMLLTALTGCDRSSRVESPAEMNPHVASIVSITAEQLGIPSSNITPDATFASLGADDLDFVEIVMATEDAHKVSIPDDALMAVAKVSASEEIVHRLTISGFGQALESAVPQEESESGEDVPTGLYAELALQPVPEGHRFLFIPSSYREAEALRDC